eukprot:CAMPEP_0177649432 /NCGR_PEP_ID=MMETSP0447-20121125/11382_1 /TAXON_ID=0 /ORGANISM="Stygamoeba regulata, Strain BSH-02190019" /LENGTH=168 /DNA_ID=CAMNT_0019152187 /DNA_START=62 /DNA_END=568 /DNA_ORIENTATION=-
MARFAVVCLLALCLAVAAVAKKEKYVPRLAQALDDLPRDLNPLMKDGELHYRARHFLPKRTVDIHLDFDVKQPSKFNFNLDRVPSAFVQVGCDVFLSNADELVANSLGFGLDTRNIPNKDIAPGHYTLKMKFSKCRHSREYQEFWGKDLEADDPDAPAFDIDVDITPL